MHIKVAHVEAGLRSFNMDMPEEINRILTDRISDILFCPTNAAVNNLNKEGFEYMNCKIMNMGDVMQDAALFYANKAKKPACNIPRSFVLCTVHRAENTDDVERLRSIFKALEAISCIMPVVLPLHPRTKIKLNAIDYEFKQSNICFIDPVGYLEMVWLLSRCQFVMTDSGGVQKEAYFFKKYCATMRDETEWIELVEHGFNFLTGCDSEKILSVCSRLIHNNQSDFEDGLYGHGHAGQFIINELSL